MKLSSVWVIRSKTGAPALAAGKGYWNGQGWGPLSDAMAYLPKDQQIQDLPTGGEWRQVTMAVED